MESEFLRFPKSDKYHIAYSVGNDILAHRFRGNEGKSNIYLLYNYNERMEILCET